MTEEEWKAISDRPRYHIPKLPSNFRITFNWYLPALRRAKPIPRLCYLQERKTDDVDWQDLYEHCKIEHTEMKTWPEHHLRKKRHKTSTTRVKSLLVSVKNNQFLHLLPQASPHPTEPQTLWSNANVAEAKLSHQFIIFFTLGSWLILQVSWYPTKFTYKLSQWQTVPKVWKQHKALLILILWLFILVTPSWISRIFVQVVLLINKPHFQMHCS